MFLCRRKEIRQIRPIFLPGLQSCLPQIYDAQISTEIGLEREHPFLIVLSSRSPPTSYKKAYLTPGKRATAVCVYEDLFLPSHCYLTPPAGERLAISTQSIHRCEVHLVGYNSFADNMGLPSFVWLLLPPKHEKCREIPREMNLTLQQFKVIQGHRFWCQWKAHM